MIPLFWSGLVTGRVFGCWLIAVAATASAQAPSGPRLDPTPRQGLEPTSSVAGTLPPRLVLATSFRGRELSYVVIDGMAVRAGDIVLGRVEDLEPRPPLAESRKPPGRTPLQRRDLSPQRGKYLWPEAVVPYIIDTDVSAEQR